MMRLPGSALVAFVIVNSFLIPIRAQEAPRGLSHEDVEAERNLKEKGHALVDMSAIWPTLNIDVCWEKSSPSSFVAQKALVRKAVKEHIEANSEYRFATVWSDCDADQRPRIRIAIEDATPRSQVGFQSATGAFGRPQPTRMWLNFTYSNWSSDNCAKPANTNRCIEFNAVHEFMHALGVLHEQLHPDVARDDPGCFAQYRDHNRFDVYGRRPAPLTQYSRNSVMNYCYREYYVDGVALSREDKLSLAEMARFSRERIAGRL